MDSSVHSGSLLYQTVALTSQCCSFLHDDASSEKLWLVQPQWWFFAAIPTCVLAEQFDLKYNKSQ